MIRVLLVPSSDYLGHPFPQRHNQLFERLHDGKSFEVHVVRFRLFDETRLKTHLMIHDLEDIKVRQAAPYYLVNMVNHVLEIRRIIRQESIDVVVLSNLTTPFAYTLMEELSSMRVPVAFDLPDYYPTSAAGYVFDVKSILGKLLAGMFDFMLRYVMKHVDVVTVASHALAEYAERAGAHRVVYVPNGISEHFLKLHDGKSMREKLGFSEKDMVVGYIGSVEFWLEMESLIRGAALARERNLPVKLLIVGNGLHTGYAKKVRGWMKQSDFERHSLWLDFVPHEEVPGYIGAFDVGTIPFDVTNPTAFYSAPNKMWEYLSQKRPLISTPIPEALNNSDCALLASTPQDYASKFALIACRDSEMLQKVEKGYNKAFSKTWKKSVECLASTLCAAVSGTKENAKSIYEVAR